MEKTQLIINVGVSGSGKTTWTTEQIKNNSNILRVNRDDIRRVYVGNLVGYYKRPDLNKIEHMVSEIERSMTVDILYKGYTCILDSTHLQRSAIDPVIDIVEALRGKRTEVKFKIFDETNPDILKLRVASRDNISLDNDTAYIDKQIKSFIKIKEYILENYSNQIL